MLVLKFFYENLNIIISFNLIPLYKGNVNFYYNFIKKGFLVKKKIKYTIHFAIIKKK